MDAVSPLSGEPGLQDDPAFFAATVLALWGLVSGIAGAAATAVYNALCDAAAWAGAGLYNLALRLANFFGSGGAAEGEAALTEAEAAQANRLHHIFDKAEHALAGLVEQFGS